MRNFLLISLFLLLPLAAQAQTPKISQPTSDGTTRESGTIRQPSTASMGDGRSPYDNLHTITGRVVQVSQPDNALTIVRPNGKQIRLILNSKTRLRADKGTELADHRTLTLADFKSGQTVKVTYFMDRSVVTEVRLSRLKK
jgi:hypothetical protein